MDPLASNISDRGTAVPIPPLLGDGHGVVSGVGEKVQVGVVLVSLVVDRYVVVGWDVVGGHVAGGGSSHLSQMKNPILLFGPSVDSF